MSFWREQGKQMPNEEFYQVQKTAEGLLVSIRQDVTEKLRNAVKFFLPWFVISIPGFFLIALSDLSSRPPQFSIAEGSLLASFFLAPIFLGASALSLLSGVWTMMSRPSHSRFLIKEDSIILIEKNKQNYPDSVRRDEIHEISWGRIGQSFDAPVGRSTIVLAGPPAVALGMAAGQAAIAGFLGAAGALGRRMNKKVFEVGIKARDTRIVLAKGLTQGEAEYVFVKLKGIIEGA
jgi:hypothetical protein